MKKIILGMMLLLATHAMSQNITAKPNKIPELSKQSKSSTVIIGERKKLEFISPTRNEKVSHGQEVTIEWTDDGSSEYMLNVYNSDLREYILVGHTTTGHSATFTVPQTAGLVSIDLYSYSPNGNVLRRTKGIGTNVRVDRESIIQKSNMFYPTATIRVYEGRPLEVKWDRNGADALTLSVYDTTEKKDIFEDISIEKNSYYLPSEAKITIPLATAGHELRYTLKSYKEGVLIGESLVFNTVVGQDLGEATKSNFTFPIDTTELYEYQTHTLTWDDNGADYFKVGIFDITENRFLSNLSLNVYKYALTTRHSYYRSGAASLKAGHKLLYILHSYKDGKLLGTSTKNITVLNKARILSPKNFAPNIVAPASFTVTWENNTTADKFIYWVYKYDLPRGYLVAPTVTTDHTASFSVPKGLSGIYSLNLESYKGNKLLGTDSLGRPTIPNVSPAAVSTIISQSTLEVNTGENITLTWDDHGADSFVYSLTANGHYSEKIINDTNTSAHSITITMPNELINESRGIDNLKFTLTSYKDGRYIGSDAVAYKLTDKDFIRITSPYYSQTKVYAGETMTYSWDAYSADAFEISVYDQTSNEFILEDMNTTAHSKSIDIPQGAAGHSLRYTLKCYKNGEILKEIGSTNTVVPLPQN